jgi:hypothetical protein
LCYVDAEVSHQPKTITEGELKACNMSEGTALQQPESEFCDTNLETILEEPACNQFEHKDEGTLCYVGRGALSLGDWVEAPGGGDDNFDTSSASKKRTNLPRQAQTHSSGEESLNPSLSFKAVFRTPKPPPAQDPIDLDCKERDGTELGEVKSGIYLSQSRKSKHSPHEPQNGSSPDVENHANHGNEAVPPSDEDDTKKGKDGDIETGNKDVRSMGYATSGQELNISPQEMDAQSVQILPDQELASSRENHVIVDDPTVLGNSGCLEQNQKLVASMDNPERSLEDCGTGAGQGKKRKHEAMTSQGLPSSRCQNCQGTSPGEGDSERLNWSTPQKADVDAGFSRRRGWCRSCKEPHPSSAPCYSPGWHPPSKRQRVKESETDEDYSWLDTYTHVAPQALTKLATAMSKASFSFSDFGIFLEFGASVNAAKCNLGLESPSEL